MLSTLYKYFFPSLSGTWYISGFMVVVLRLQVFLLCNTGRGFFFFGSIYNVLVVRESVEHSSSVSLKGGCRIYVLCEELGFYL